MPSGEQRGKIRYDLMTEYADMLATKSDIRPMTGWEMQIHLQESTIPFQVRKVRLCPWFEGIQQRQNSTG